MNKRSHNLHTSTLELGNDFMLALQGYAPEVDIQSQFPAVDTPLRNDVEVPQFLAVSRDFVETITDRTARGLNTEGVPSKYAGIFPPANASASSRLLKTLVGNCIPLNHARELGTDLGHGEDMEQQTTRGRRWGRRGHGGHRAKTQGSRRNGGRCEAAHDTLCEKVCALCFDSISPTPVRVGVKKSIMRYQLFLPEM